MTKIIAHRGLRNRYPENTIAAISAALKLPGLYGVEFDLELAADRKLVALHQETMVADPTFSKLMPAPRDFVRRDWVLAHQQSELVKLDAGSWVGEQFSAERVPTLVQILSLPWGEVVPFIELKDPTYWGERDHDRPAQIVNALLTDASNLSAQAAFISFNPEILRLIRSKFTKAQTVLALWNEWRGKIAGALTVANDIGAQTISLSEEMLFAEPHWVSAAHQKGIAVHVFPVSKTVGEGPESASGAREETLRRLVAVGVDAVISDHADIDVQFTSSATFTSVPHKC